MPRRTMSKDTALTLTFAILVLVTRSSVFIFTPLYLDSLTPTTTVLLNISNFTNGTDIDDLLPGRPIQHQIDPLFVITFSMGFDTLVLGVMLLLTRVFQPGKITERETGYSKKSFVIAGGTQGISSSLFLYASSGARTAPYLQAVLGNFHIPITFSLRFLILRKKPTLRKLLCASAVATAEFMTLIPTVFPQLEPPTEHEREGGASGIGRILWPLVFVSSMLPAALSNIAQEKIYKDKKKKEEEEEEEAGRLNMVYALFWTYFFIFITTLLLFWSDFIPGYGTTSSIKTFGELMAFNFLCVFGATEVCKFPVPFFAWGRMISKTFNVLVSAFLLRYGEGANFLVIILAMRTPVVFLFWTMFSEQPFYWDPHAELSTWLSVAAIFIMIPAMILYQTGAPETTVPKRPRTNGQAADERPILTDVDASTTEDISQRDRTGEGAGRQEDDAGEERGLLNGTTNIQ